MNAIPTNPKQDNPPYDVIIAGAGPVGLFLACELALAQCSVLILEKATDQHSPLKQMPFGIRGLNAPSIETLYRRGLLDALHLHKRLKNPHQNGGTGAQRQVGHFAGIPFLEGNIDTTQWPLRLPGAPPTALMTEMQELETALTERALRLGVKILYGCALSNFQQTEEGVTVQCDQQSFQGKWLVGCDGARSIVRKLGGFDFAGTEPEFTGYSVLADIADPEKLKPGRNITPQGMYLQSQPGYLAIQDFDGGAFHGSGQAITAAHIQEVLRRVSGTDVTISALHIATTWTDRARQATSYRKGRVLLAGDAAHIHAPLGGQGLNLGLGDAMNLGWKLAAAIHNKAPHGLLDTYEAERHTIGMHVLDWSRAQAAIMKPDPASRALQTIMRDVLATRDGATYFAGRVWGVHTRYELAGGYPLAGYNVPDFELADGSRLGAHMRNGKGVLLDFNSSPALAVIAQAYSDSLNYLPGPAKDQLGLNAVLVRPDGIVAWAAADEVDDASLLQVLSYWFGAGKAIQYPA